jgi:hypothetical protein
MVIIALHRQLDTLGEGISRYHVRVRKALETATHAALRAGDKLRVAHTVLKRIRNRSRSCLLAPTPPTWKEWVRKKCRMSVRTSEVYKRLSKNRKLFKHVLKKPNVSIRLLLYMLAKHSDDPNRPSSQELELQTATVEVARREMAENPPRQPSELNLARDELRQCFDEHLKRWSPALVVQLGRDRFGEALFEQLLDETEEEAMNLLHDLIEKRRRENARVDRDWTLGRRDRRYGARRYRHRQEREREREREEARQPFKSTRRWSDTAQGREALARQATRSTRRKSDQRQAG